MWFESLKHAGDHASTVATSPAAQPDDLNEIMIQTQLDDSHEPFMMMHSVESYTWRELGFPGDQQHDSREVENDGSVEQGGFNDEENVGNIQQDGSDDHENDPAVESLSQTFLQLALRLQALGEDKVQELVSKYATSSYKLVHARTSSYMPV
jgi:hypothetical protein